ncbi:hypothetical protein MMF83_00028395 [Klebsiella pneumoniae]
MTCDLGYIVSTLILRPSECDDGIAAEGDGRPPTAGWALVDNSTHYHARRSYRIVMPPVIVGWHRCCCPCDGTAAREGRQFNI